MHVSLCTLRVRLSAVPAPEEQHCMAPAITVTEDNSIPVDDDDFVEYYGLQAYIEGRLYITIIIASFISGSVAST